MDFKDAAPVVQELTGIEEVGAAIRFYEKNKDVIHAVIAFFRGLFRHAQAPTAVPPPDPIVLGPIVATPPPAIAGTAGDVAALMVKLLFVEKAVRNNDGQRGGIEPLDRFKEILAGANIDDGSWLHTDCSPVGDDGTEIATNDPRWATLNHSWPNGNVIFPYYEFNGKLTHILHGDQGSPEVEPGSFEDDEGCTVTYKIEGKGTFRFGYLARRRDGRLIDSGLVGPFHIA